MNDHIESLQIDLNTIKDFLTTNSFNQIDPYTINNVSYKEICFLTYTKFLIKLIKFLKIFSPMVLEQIDNEPYFITNSTSNSNNFSDSNEKIIGNTFSN